MSLLINATSDIGDLIVDPFGGCGSTLAAAISLNRRCIAIDNNPKTLAVMQQRMTVASKGSARAKPISAIDPRTPHLPSLLSPREVRRLLGVSTSTLRRMVLAGSFPKPTRIGAQRVGWPDSQVKAWLADRGVEIEGQVR